MLDRPEFHIQKLPKEIKIIDSWWFNTGNALFCSNFRCLFKIIGIIKFSNGTITKHHIGLCPGNSIQEDIAFIYYYGTPFILEKN